MHSLSRSASLFAHHSAQSGLHAAMTIAARTPGLLSPSEANAREAALMVEEKVAAACEGAVGATLAWGSFLFACALRGGATPEQFSHALLDVAEAAAKPARRTVRANARRLSRGSKAR